MIYLILFYVLPALFLTLAALSLLVSKPAPDTETLSGMIFVEFMAWVPLINIPLTFITLIVLLADLINKRNQ